MKPILTIVAFILGLSTSLYGQNDSMDFLYNHFKTGNSKELGKNFASNVEIILVDEEDVYSKAYF
ncbi:MAG: DUF4783 domain-containing protein [Chitinophagaceae bacterium]|nr:MAG: DUF4783 domain-containing protein [Chitinophagaceae bacterium]